MQGPLSFPSSFIFNIFFVFLGVPHFFSLSLPTPNYNANHFNGYWEIKDQQSFKWNLLVFSTACQKNNTSTYSYNINVITINDKFKVNRQKIASHPSNLDWDPFRIAVWNFSKVKENKTVFPRITTSLFIGFLWNYILTHDGIQPRKKKNEQTGLPVISTVLIFWFFTCFLFEKQFCLRYVSTRSNSRWLQFWFGLNGEKIIGTYGFRKYLIKCVCQIRCHDYTQSCS